MATMYDHEDCQYFMMACINRMETANSYSDIATTLKKFLGYVIYLCNWPSILLVSPFYWHCLYIKLSTTCIETFEVDFLMGNWISKILTKNIFL